MTLPVTPGSSLSIAQINTESGVASTTNKGLNWLSSNSKVTATNLGAQSGLAWYYKTNAYFNCTLDNRNSQCNCNNCPTSQCSYGGGFAPATFCPSSTTYASYTACANCACDNRSWLQANCNTPVFNNCAYDCYINNCNCNCRC